MKKNVIPLFIHHETGEKPQAGKDNKQQYLKFCIQQAEKYGNTVYLFGDKGNKAWSTKWIDIHSIVSLKWERFLTVFENFSTYPDSWAKGILHRFFLFEEYAKLNNVDSFFLIDSDVLVYAQLQSLYDWSTVSFAASFLKDNQLGDEIANQFRWTVNAGVSYWSLEALERFTDFCIEIYENNKEILMPKWHFHQKYHYPGGICEMSLIYLWCQREQGLKVLNIVSEEISGGIFNSDINGTENYEKKEMKTSLLLGIKKYKILNDTLYLIRRRGRMIKAYNLHFVGDAKMLMQDFYMYGKVTFKTYCVYSIYNLKKKMGQLYRRFKRKLNHINR